MNCSDIKYKFVDYHRGVISQDECNQISEHITVCKSCRNDSEEIIALIKKVSDDKSWEPSKAYWNNLLPRIYSKLEDKKKKYFPIWVTRWAFPVAAAALLVVLSMEFFRITQKETNEVFPLSLTQISQDELQYYVDEQTILGVERDRISGDGIIASDDDKVILKNIIEETDYFVGTNGDYESFFDSINEQEADNIVTLLEKKLISV